MGLLFYGNPLSLTGR